MKFQSSAVILFVHIFFHSDCRAFSLTNSLKRDGVAPTFLYASTVEVSPSTEEGVNGAFNNNTSSLDSINDDDTVFDLIAGRTAVFMVESDSKRNAVGLEGAEAPSATKWIDEHTAYALRQAFDMLKLQLPDERRGVDRDETSHWIRFFKAIPAPAIIDFSTEFRNSVNATLSQHRLDLLHKSRNEVLNRIGCRLILLPSGTALSSPLVEFPNGLIYGKLLYGGVTRSRLLSSSSHSSHNPPRTAGVRQEIKRRVDDNVPSWMMFGGANRMYEAVDMGPAAVLEVVTIPQGTLDGSMGDNMVFGGLAWPPQKIFTYYDSDKRKDNDGEDSLNNPVYTASSLSGRERNDAFRSEFTTSVGGLQKQIDAIVRRVLDGRVIRPADKAAAVEDEDADDTSRDLSIAAIEAEELALLGLTRKLEVCSRTWIHKVFASQTFLSFEIIFLLPAVRGLLLYGPPGTGKTMLAREISRALRARAPKIVSAPELLDRWVGGSEKLVRGLFADAQAELAVHNGDASKSALHVIVIDEIDAVFRKRSSSEDTGEATRASVVNQILSCLDGVNAIPNILMIGMTNRRELLDEALLRPGRLEVQIEIPLPDKEGRREILQIHFEALRRRGRLSMPLCCAIDGVALTSQPERTQNDSPTDSSSTRSGVWSRIRKLSRQLPTGRRVYDLAEDYATGGFSGADIAGLVRAAGSLALSRARRDGSGVGGLMITLEDVQQALSEVKS